MANVKLIFQGTEKSKTDKVSLEVYVNSYNEVALWLEENDELPSLISFDKSTAVRLVRELKKQIGYLESEVNNG